MSLIHVFSIHHVTTLSLPDHIVLSKRLSAPFKEKLSLLKIGIVQYSWGECMKGGM